MNDRFAEFERLGAEILVVSFADPGRLADHQTYLGLRFTVASDVERRAYRDYGLLTGSFFQVWHPKVILKYVSLAMRGMKPKMPYKDADLAQLGGDFVIGPDGRVAYAYTSTRPDDRPPVDDLLDALKAQDG